MEENKKEWISFKEKKPNSGQIIWLKQDELMERAVFRSESDIELILPPHKISSIMTQPTHWKNDTY